MRLTLLLPFLLLGVLLSAQNRAGAVIDAVHLKDGSTIEGTVLEYNYGREVIIVMEDGGVRSVEWKEIKRVNFRVDKNRMTETLKIKETAEENVLEETEEIPRRRYRHQVSTNLSFGRTRARFFGNATALGGGVGYHVIRSFGRFTAGLGVDANLMSYRRSENVVSATGLVDYPINMRAKRIRMFLRLEAGPSLPFGSSDDTDEITERMVTVLFHPAIGLEFLPKKDRWGSITADLGYRFLDSRFTITTNTLDVVERNVQYRRLMLRGAIRF